MNNPKEDFLTRNIVSFAFVLVVIGLIVIAVFLFRSPFNDWSGETDAALFGQYGDFIGGFIGTFFSLAGFFLLYKTLLAQQKTIKLQSDEIEIQRKTTEKESFETTFFNLLNIQQNITNNIKAYFRSINGLTDEKIKTVEGREFFMYSVSELSKINYSIFSTKYLGTYDVNEMEYWEHYINELFDTQSPHFTHPDEAERERANIIQETSIKYANKFYRISKPYWENASKKTLRVRLQYVYTAFFRRFHYAVGHYFRNLYHLLDFIEQFENSQINKTENIEERNEIKKNCKKYAQFIQAQMSSYELTLLYYNVLCFPKALRLVKKYKLLDNLFIEDLIDTSHNCEDGIRLKNRRELFET